MAAIWAGIDAGKTHHHCVAIDESGRRLLSRRVANDEPELLANVLALGDEVTRGIDLADGGAALAIGILLGERTSWVPPPGHPLSPVLQSRDRPEARRLLAGAVVAGAAHGQVGALSQPRDVAVRELMPVDVSGHRAPAASGPAAG